MDASSARKIANNVNAAPTAAVLYGKIGEAISAAAEEGKYSVDYALPQEIGEKQAEILLNELKEEGFSAYCYIHSSMAQGLFPVDNCYHFSISWREYCED